MEHTSSMVPLSMPDAHQENQQDDSHLHLELYLNHEKGHFYMICF
ncbi:hypothetical protein BvCmsG79A_02261 [Escherichia coli]|nr:hypothetical protein BvCmsG79A_02261 [Escherichia coli]